MRCSNPNCRQLTSGPRSDLGKAVNVGVAAHITAAAPGGPRYESSLAATERSSPKNGVWLCQNHAKLVDNDPVRYPVDLLHEWKRLAESAAALEVDGTTKTQAAKSASDVELMRFFAQCFDRPAFQDPFVQEGSAEDLDRAISDTLTAINTGCLRSRDGVVLAQAQGGKSFLLNRNWRLRMDEVAALLRALRSRYDGAKRVGGIHAWEEANGKGWRCINDSTLADWMDRTRGEVLRVFAEVCREADIQSPVFPRPQRVRW